MQQRQQQPEPKSHVPCAATSGTFRSSSAPTTSSTRALSRKNRVFVFREFLVETYGEYLSREQQHQQQQQRHRRYHGAGVPLVLDVAGGRGDLSWLLRHADGYGAVVADPRETTGHAHWLRSIEYLLVHPEEAARRAVPGLPTFQPLAQLLPTILRNHDRRHHHHHNNDNIDDHPATILQNTKFDKPRHLRIFVDNDLIRAVRQYQQSQSIEQWEQYWYRASKKVSVEQGQSTKKSNNPGTEESSSSSSSLHHSDDSNDNQIHDPMVALQTILAVRLVVGFHPDQVRDSLLSLFPSASRLQTLHRQHLYVLARMYEMK